MPGPDAGDAGGEREVGQAGAVSERRASDADEVVGQRDVGQGGALIEHPAPRLVTLFGIVTLVMFAQPLNAVFPMLTTG